MLQIAAPDCPVCTFYALLEQNNCALARCIIWGEWIIRCGFRGISKGMGFKVWVSISAWVIFLISQARERVCRLIYLLRCMHLRGKPNICITFPCSHINPSLICGCECVKIVFFFLSFSPAPAECWFSNWVFRFLLANWQSCGSKVACRSTKGQTIAKSGCSLWFFCAVPAIRKSHPLPSKYILVWLPLGACVSVSVQKVQNTQQSAPK